MGEKPPSLDRDRPDPGRRNQDSHLRARRPWAILTFPVMIPRLPNAYSVRVLCNTITAHRQPEPGPANPFYWGLDRYHFVESIVATLSVTRVRTNQAFVPKRTNANWIGAPLDFGHCRVNSPPEIISHAVWLYHRYCMSFRDVEDLLAERGIIVSYETVRQWCGKFGPDYARQLKRRQGRLGDTWFLDEVFVTINGQRQYLWRAVDQDGDLIDILVQPRRDGRAARRFFRRLLKSQRQEPVRLVTDKLGSYRVAHRDLMPLVTHDTRRYANNRAEVSHQPTRQRERQMRGFTSSDHAQRFLHVHGVIQNLFRVGRHLLRAAHHRMLRARSFTVWAQVTAA